MLDAAQEDLAEVSSRTGLVRRSLLLLIAQWVDVGYRDDGCSTLCV